LNRRSAGGHRGLLRPCSKTNGLAVCEQAPNPIDGSASWALIHAPAITAMPISSKRANRSCASSDLSWAATSSGTSSGTKFAGGVVRPLESRPARVETGAPPARRKVYSLARTRVGVIGKGWRIGVRVRVKVRSRHRSEAFRWRPLSPMPQRCPAILRRTHARHGHSADGSASLATCWLAA